MSWCHRKFYLNGVILHVHQQLLRNSAKYSLSMITFWMKMNHVVLHFKRKKNPESLAIKSCWVIMDLSATEYETPSNLLHYQKEIQRRVLSLRWGCDDNRGVRCGRKITVHLAKFSPHVAERHLCFPESVIMTAHRLRVTRCTFNPQTVSSHTIRDLSLPLTVEVSVSFDFYRRFSLFVFWLLNINVDSKTKFYFHFMFPWCSTDLS